MSFFSCEFFPSVDDYITVVRVYFHGVAGSHGLFCCHECGSTSTEWVQDDVSFFAAVLHGIRYEFYGFHGGMFKVFGGFLELP